MSRNHVVRTLANYSLIAAKNNQSLIANKKRKRVFQHANFIICNAYIVAFG